MKHPFFKGVALGAITSTVVLIAATALAGTGIGGVFNLGKTNTVNETTTLTGAKAGKQLQVTNTSIGAGATGIGINVKPGKPPLTVNSSTRVANLNADKLDGVDSKGLIQGTGQTYTLAVAIHRSQFFQNTIYTPNPPVAANFFNVGFECPGLPNTNGAAQLEIQNASSNDANLFFRNDNFKDADYEPMYSGQYTTRSTNKPGDLSTLTFQGSPTGTTDQTVLTAQVSTTVRTDDCHFQVQALITHR
jgi:hypothetical protein